jgi:peptide/nickel transport system substrate-binding protein
MATDNQVLSEDREAGVEPPANGPYSPTQVGYLEDTGYPEFDLQGAIDLVNEYEAENGPLSITFNTTNDPYNRETNELIAANWQAAGIDVTINTVEQGQYILDALQGNFQVFGWRNHGGVDPDSQRIWWHSETGDAATNPLALNFGGIDDPDIDAQLEIIRTSNDDAERQAAAEEINRIFGEQVYNIWNTWTVWGLAHKPTVHGIHDFAFPDGGGGTLPGAGIAGTHQVSQMWVEQ